MLTIFIALFTFILSAILFFSSCLPTKLGLCKSIFLSPLILLSRGRLGSLEPIWTGFTPYYAPPKEEWPFTLKHLYTSYNLSGQIAIITGANAGLGYEISLALARCGATVIMACRNIEKAELAAQKIRSDFTANSRAGKVVPMILDTSSLKSVKSFAFKFLGMHNTVDMLYFNAGSMTQQKLGDKIFPLSEDGIELTFATHVVGHHLLYKLLRPAIFNTTKRTTTTRIVFSSSCGSFNPMPSYGVATDLKTLNNAKVDFFSPMYVYGQAKLAQILWVKHLTRLLQDDATKMKSNNLVVVANAVHPGCVSTEIWDKNPGIPKWLGVIFSGIRGKMWTPEEGALTLLHLGVSPPKQQDDQNGFVSGKYYHPQSTEVINPASLDEDLEERVWRFCDKLIDNFM